MKKTISKEDMDVGEKVEEEEEQEEEEKGDDSMQDELATRADERCERLLGA